VIVRALIGVFFLASVAGAAGIPKWQTPSGTLHFGDNPPAGSVLLETIGFPETAERQEEALAPAYDIEGAIARAAAEGRDIIRRRAEERAAERLHRIEVEEYARLEEPPQTIVIASGDPFHFHRFPKPPRAFRDHDRFKHKHDRFQHSGFQAGFSIGSSPRRSSPGSFRGFHGSFGTRTPRGPGRPGLGGISGSGFSTRSPGLRGGTTSGGTGSRGVSRGWLRSAGFSGAAN
jgi:hypothetical protein